MRPFAGGVDVPGQLFGLLFGGGQFGRNGGDGFVAVRDRLQACFVIGLFGEEFAEICGTVFLAERVDGVESVADFCSRSGSASSRSLCAAAEAPRSFSSSSTERSRPAASAAKG